MDADSTINIKFDSANLHLNIPILALFRCQKPRCQRWKNILGFVETHRYADLSEEQCNKRLVVCDLHFTSGSYTNNNVRARLNYNAVPSLNLHKTHIDVSIQTDLDESLQIDLDNDLKEYNDASSQTYTFTRNKLTQTRKAMLKEEITSLKRVSSETFESPKDPKYPRQIIETDVSEDRTLEDVSPFQNIS